ncbi:F0F1 ATP synthase subunit I [Sansalvadorimonas verongulae]|uniref:F0F1 ATP synthase subunit I n=1 Tax=Sansalvadorimonas verongulae TaxID=2172824 RepID=UPI0012BBCB3E|nr:F0F1 ATP synthase subunit I [Sansalvadorimonas verongulae]MTI14016.1 F0F1 ATP synthase subunit I [Sansalvadorimonas verongulae]
MQSPHLRKPPVFRVIYAQMAATVLVSVAFLASGRTAAVSALLGGMICFVPNAYLVFRAFSLSGARAARKIVNEFYKGEAGKFFLTCCGFALVFALVRPLDAVALFGAFVLVQAVNWFTPALLKAGF